jgi:hypothetical protein
MSPVRIREVPRPEDVPESDADLLAWLEGPAWLRQPGRSGARVRAVATLLHGNEPSGLRALRAWWRSGERPAVDAVFFVGAVEAARAAPGFAHRMLPGRRDLNRCFRPPFDGPEGALAEAALRLLREARPEALLDLHNNTGHNPAYGVGRGLDAARLALVGLFARRYVRSDLRLGTLVEAFEGVLPAVTIECGRAGDPAADATAFAGLARYLRADHLGPDAGPGLPFQVLVEPVRVCLRDGTRVAFGDAPAPQADLTLAADVDRHNFERLPAGSAIGWVDAGAPWPLEAREATGADVSRALFELDAGVLRTRRDGVPIMMTTDPRIAAEDCLFYLARPADAPGCAAADPS